MGAWPKPDWNLDPKHDISVPTNIDPGHDARTLNCHRKIVDDYDKYLIDGEWVRGWVCPKCGTEDKPTVKFCWKCRYERS